MKRSSPAMQKRGYLTVAEAAPILDVTTRTVWRYIRIGRLKTRVHAGVTYVRHEDAEALGPGAAP